METCARRKYFLSYSLHKSRTRYRYIFSLDTSKKLAKRAAAYQMVEQLEKMDIDFLTAKQAGGPDIDGPTHDVTQVKLIEK